MKWVINVDRMFGGPFNLSISPAGPFCFPYLQIPLNLLRRLPSITPISRCFSITRHYERRSTCIPYRHCLLPSPHLPYPLNLVTPSQPRNHHAWNLALFQCQPVGNARLIVLRNSRFAIFTLVRLVRSWVPALGSCMSSPLFVPSFPTSSLLTPSRYLLEHGLKADGRIDEERIEEIGDGGFRETFFAETGNGKYVPRSVFVDLDPSVRISS